MKYGACDVLIQREDLVRRRTDWTGSSGLFSFFLKDDNNYFAIPGGKSPATKTCRDGYSVLFSVLAETQSRVGRIYRITITQPAGLTIAGGI